MLTSSSLNFGMNCIAMPMLNDGSDGQEPNPFSNLYFYISNSCYLSRSWSFLTFCHCSSCILSTWWHHLCKSWCRAHLTYHTSTTDCTDARRDPFSSLRSTTPANLFTTRGNTTGALHTDKWTSPQHTIHGPGLASTTANQKQIPYRNDTRQRHHTSPNTNYAFCQNCPTRSENTWITPPLGAYSNTTNSALWGALQRHGQHFIENHAQQMWLNS